MEEEGEEEKTRVGVKMTFFSFSVTSAACFDVRQVCGYVRK